MTTGVEPQHADLVLAAERVLAERFGAALKLGNVQQMSDDRRRSLLLRCRVLAGPADSPQSVVVKQARLQHYDPNDPTSRPAVGLFRDWAGLEFLATVDDGRLASPRFLGGDRQAGFFIMEDLGGGRELDAVLTRGSENEARRALLMLAEALGRMHALTAGRSDEYQAIRDTLGPGDGRQRLKLAEHARDYGPALRERCEALQVEVSPSFATDIEEVAEAMANPGPFLAYTHGDACPDNCVVAGDRLRLFDFEFGNFRHALLDGVYGRFRFPTCWGVRDIPAEVLAEMEAAYRRELAVGCPAAADDTLYFRAIADACAYWMLENLAQLFGRAIRYEEPKGTSTNRQRLLTRLAAFCEVAERADHLPGLRKTFQNLLDELRRLWATKMPLFDAFGQNFSLHENHVRELVNAVKAGDAARVSELLGSHPGLANAKVDDADQTPVLYLAIETQSAELVRLLLRHGARWQVTTRSGWTALALSCSRGTPEIVDLLLAAGADVNTRDAWGTLPLYGAVAARNVTMLKHLLDRGARPDLKTAIDLNDLELARRLVRRDASCARIRFGTGLTLLHDAAQVGDARLDAIRLLLDCGCPVDATTNWGAAPLHLAAFHGHAGTIACLLASGADAGAKDKRGLTPQMLAEGRGHAKCAALLSVEVGSATGSATGTRQATRQATRP